MDAMTRLEHSITRVKSLVNLYKQHPTTTLDMIDSMTAVTIGDLKILLDGLADRDISISKMPELVGLGKLHRETIEAREVLEKERWEWIKGYDKGYTAGRDGELKRIETLINNYLHGN